MAPLPPSKPPGPPTPPFGATKVWLIAPVPPGLPLMSIVPLMATLPVARSMIGVFAALRANRSVTPLFTVTIV